MGSHTIVETEAMFDSARAGSRPSLDSVVDLLANWGGLVVHFSGTPPMGDGIVCGNLYPKDLHHCISGAAQGGLSCSVIRSDDHYDVTNGNHPTCVGSIGVIVRPRSAASIVWAQAADLGTHKDSTLIRVSGYEHLDLSLEDLALSLTGRQSNRYNEWVVRDYDVIGIFAIPPFHFWARQDINSVPGSAEMPEYLKLDDTYGPSRSSLDAIVNEFAPLPIVTIQNGRFVSVRKYLPPFG